MEWDRPVLIASQAVALALKALISYSLDAKKSKITSA